MISRDLAKFTDVRRYAMLVCIISEARVTLTAEGADSAGYSVQPGKTHAGRTIVIEDILP